MWWLRSGWQIPVVAGPAAVAVAAAEQLEQLQPVQLQQPAVELAGPVTAATVQHNTSVQ